MLAQLAMLRDDDLEQLAKAFRNTPSRRDARDIALTPDSPLIIEVLSVFGAISTIFADDLAGEEDFVSVDPAVTAHALKAVRDAVAAAYARPILTRAQHRALMAPWRAVCAPTTQTEPDLGPADAEIAASCPGFPGSPTAATTRVVRRRSPTSSIPRARWTRKSTARPWRWPCRRQC